MADFYNLTVPHDKDAKQKLAECDKLVKRINFERAIEVGDPPSAAEGLDLNSIGRIESDTSPMTTNS